MSGHIHTPTAVLPGEITLNSHCTESRWVPMPVWMWWRREKWKFLSIPRNQSGTSRSRPVTSLTKLSPLQLT